MAECNVIPNSTCRYKYNAKCVIYRGPRLSAINTFTYDNLQEIIININSAIQNGILYTASNRGSGVGVFASKVGTDFQFKSLVEGSGIDITYSDNEITISATGVAGNSWLLVGNSGTNPPTNFLGTTDVQPIIFKTNSIWNGILSPFGNIGFGIHALENANDFGAIGIGANALKISSVAGLAIGNNALNSHYGGLFPLAIGHDSQSASVNAQFNVSLGHQTLFSNISSNYNTAVGHQALYFTTVGYNTAVGYQALYNNGIGNQNAAFGMNAGLNNTDGIKNVFIGAGSGENNTIGSFNTFMGQDSGLNNVDGYRNIYIGWNAKGGASAYQNIIMGYGSGASLTSGNDNVIIGGFAAGWNAGQKVDAVNTIVIGSNAFSIVDNEIVLGNSLITQLRLPWAVPHDDTETKFLTWNSVTNDVEYRDMSTVVGVIPTLQQVLTSGNTSVGNNLSITGGTNVSIYSSINNGFNLNSSGNMIIEANGGSLTIGSAIDVNINSGLLLSAITNNTLQDRLIGQISSSKGIGYITLGSGLSLSGGVLNTSGTVPTPISSLTAATGTNNINNADYQQRWTWDSLTQGNGLIITSISTAAQVNSQKLVQFSLSGANATSSQRTYTTEIVNNHTGTSSTNVALSLLAIGGTNNYALIIDSGQGLVGIGTSTPTSLLHVNGASGFRYVDGNQTAGWILSEDINGVASWVNPTSIVTATPTFGQVVAAGNSTTARIVVGPFSTSTAQLSLHQSSLSSGTGYALRSENASAVSGTSTMYGVWSKVSAAGGTVTNIAGYFEAISGTNNYAIIVPSGGGNVGIGTLSPTTLLHINGANSFRYVDGNQGVGKILVSDINGVGSWTNSSSVVPSLTATQIAFGDVSNLMTSSSNLVYDSLNIRLNIGSPSLLLGNLNTNGNIWLSGGSYYYATHDGSNQGTYAATGLSWYTGSGTVGLSNVLGNLQIDGVATKSVVFNEGGADIDVRMEGDTDPNLFFLDASTDRIGIGTATPATNLHSFKSGSGSSNTLKVEQGNNSAISLQATWGNTSIITTDQLYFQVAGANRGYIGSSLIAMNTDQTNTDFQVRGQVDTNALYVDASSDSVGVKTATPTSSLHINGSLTIKRTAVSADTTLDSTHYYVVVDATVANRTITLPTASGIEGRVYGVRKSDSSVNTVTLDGHLAETINGSANFVLTNQYETLWVVSDGTNWEII